ncbi:hypothetical protein SAY87_014686 [Trapa incisa]|uniref:DC-UbP/UBTD2 N-terminal domain-containing protein n=1 Tax=Trapa incisa TaxID=236973 RepID=A0AAN7GKG6_9MYRT|nr:hypothetical protein SAY87_014686 [Trapa incisa]
MFADALPEERCEFSQLMELLNFYSLLLHNSGESFFLPGNALIKLTDTTLLQITEIWDALRAAAEADRNLAQAIVDSAGVIVQNPDLTICYDERGAKYELPKYVLSEPTNLIQDN